MTPENLAKANAAQKAADERRRREAEEARRKRDSETPKLHAVPGQRRGQLRNGNPTGDYGAAPRCGAHTRSGTSCRQPAMANGRCRFHGGLSTGPRTAEGLRNSRTARFVHGGRTAEIIDLRSAAARSARRMKLLLAAARSATSPAGHEVDRSLSPCSWDEAQVNRKDTKLVLGPRVARTRGAQSDRVARVAPLHQDKSMIARPQAAQESFKASLLASTAAFTRPLRVFAPLRFNSSAPAGHGLDRSFSPTRRAA
jgi:hypothetical protein